MVRITTSKWYETGHVISGNEITAHISTAPASSKTVYDVFSRPTSAPGFEKKGIKNSVLTRCGESLTVIVQD